MESQLGKDLHREIAAILKNESLTGTVWATITPESGAKIGAAGIKNANTGEKLAANDRVHIGSFTKTLVAAGVLRLVTQGKLKLEAPISELLPKTIIDNPWFATDQYVYVI